LHQYVFSGQAYVQLNSMKLLCGQLEPMPPNDQREISIFKHGLDL